MMVPGHASIAPPAAASWNPSFGISQYLPRETHSNPPSSVFPPIWCSFGSVGGFTVLVMVLRLAEACCAAAARPGTDPGIELAEDGS